MTLKISELYFSEKVLDSLGFKFYSKDNNKLAFYKEDDGEYFWLTVDYEEKIYSLFTAEIKEYNLPYKNIILCDRKESEEIHNYFEVPRFYETIIKEIFGKELRYEYM